MNPSVQVRGLRKSYGTFEAVKGVDFDIHRGEVFGLLGPNGAGKTTTVEILEGLRPRNAGEVSVLGVDPARQDRAGVRGRRARAGRAQGRRHRGVRQDRAAGADRRACPRRRAGRVLRRLQRAREGARRRARARAIPLQRRDDGQECGRSARHLARAAARTAEGNLLGAELDVSGPLFTAEGGHVTEYFSWLEAIRDLSAGRTELLSRSLVQQAVSQKRLTGTSAALKKMTPSPADWYWDKWVNR